MQLPKSDKSKKPNNHIIITTIIKIQQPPEITIKSYIISQ